jgi:transposase
MKEKIERNNEIFNMYCENVSIKKISEIYKLKEITILKIIQRYKE